jgi:hypothetical protein
MSYDQLINEARQSERVLSDLLRPYTENGVIKLRAGAGIELSDGSGGILLTDLYDVLWDRVTQAIRGQAAK